MNKSLAVFLASNECRMIKISYEPDDKSPVGFKTFDKSLKVDDLVVIPTNTRHEFTVAKVVAVDIEVDLDTGTQYQWIAGRFDPKGHLSTLEREAKMLEAIRSAELKRKREQLKSDLINDLGGDENLLIIDANSSDEKTE